MTSSSASNTNAANGSRKRKIHPLLDSEFRDALIGGRGGTLQLTRGAANVLHDCQEEFVAQLTRTLKLAQSQQSSKEDEGKGVRWIQPPQVEAAMKAMGLADVLQEALRHLDRQTSCGEDKSNSISQPDSDEPATAGKKRRKKKNWSKKEPFSAEMMAEQERLLLAASLQRQS